MIIDVKPATTLAEVADQMEEAIGMCVDHYVNVCDVVLSNWSMLCRSVDVDALLALADEMEQAGKDYRYQMVENACCDNLVNDAPDDFIDYARSIREALGAGR